MKRYVLLMTMLFLTLYGCGGGSGDGSPSTSDLGPQLTGWFITPEEESRAVDQSIQFDVTGQLDNGDSRIITDQCSFVSSNESIAFFDAQKAGLAWAENPGTATIIVTCPGDLGEKYAQLNVTAAAPAQAALILTPEVQNIFVGKTLQYTATATYDDGSTRTVNDQCIFSSSDDNIARFRSEDREGRVTATGEGTAIITARCPDNFEDSATLTVTNDVAGFTFEPKHHDMYPDIPERFCAFVTDASGEVLDEVCSETAYSGYDETVIRYEGSGWFRGIADGEIRETTITGLFQDFTDTATARVLDVEVTNLTADPQAVSLPASGSQPVTVTALYDNDAAKEVTDLATWSSDNPDIAYYMNGQIWGGAPGSTILRVTWQGIATEILVTVGN